MWVAAAVNADTVHLKCTADTNVSSYATEQGLNYGKSSRIRLKGIEMIGLFQFDSKPIEGWTIHKATLYLRYAGSDRKLRTLGISTISAPWSEGTGSAEAKPGETCFLGNGPERWAGPQTDFTDVSFTAGNTIAAYADITSHTDDWISVPVEPRLVQAMVAGATYGIAVSDEKGQTRANNDIYSREQNGSEPYLVVEGAKLAPKPPQGMAAPVLAPDAKHADFQHGAVTVAITPPTGVFSYEIVAHYGARDLADVREVSRATIPFATPGRMQTFCIAGLPPSVQVQLQVTAVGADGSRGATLTANGNASPAKIEPVALKRFSGHRSPTPTGRLDNSRALFRRAWACSETDKVNPETGNIEGLPEVAKWTNSVWDGEAIRLTSARNEILGYQIIVENPVHDQPVNGITVETPGAFEGPKGSVLKHNTETYRMWYVHKGGWHPEACIPLNGPFNIPSVDNGIPHQNNQSIFVEMRIPADTTPGEYVGVIHVNGPSFSVPLPIDITISSLILPDTLSFDISLNTYGTFGGLFGLNDNTPEYRAIERDFHRMAYAHRSTLAPLGYSHTGNITTNYAPPLEGVGAAMHVTDWTNWDRQFGAYLDGSAFADLGRHGAPISHLYLPFHEAWPVDIRRHYSYEQTVMDYPAMIVEHAMKAEPIEHATDQELRDGFKSVAAQFAAHFREKGWTHTMFQFYQNDKNYYKDPKEGGRGTSWWLLDEPNHRDDWLVLGFFNRLFEQGIGKSPGVNLVMREDISRPQWQRDYFDGLVDLMCVSGELFTKGPRLREMQEKLGVKFWNYGTANSVDRPNTEEEAWAIRAWLAGADAIVPWQSIGADKNFDVAEDTALLLPGTRFGVHGPIASLRLKALRRAQQDVEYLVLLAKAKGWDREQVGAALRDILSLKLTTVKADDNDAGSYQFSATRADDFSAMRRAIGEALSR
jgi:hypothetical protein